ncbi:hypothetical protein AJ80_01150 [Polytolypa hystricis UAMH7299]|uniref:Ribosomal RNA-processing protein 15 n=1 Tax=Polytolypa hystricis (strain UAMH7299) TaxID=1447883 RepID=A0A2B7Z1T0_POLH7|nr:hypothetical protein AJ80_01150 [Polytolypa hystricis UAMH7299]
MAPSSLKKRKVEEGMQGRTSRPKKRFRKQRAYHSSSEDEDEQQQDTDFRAVNLQDSDAEDDRESLNEDVLKQITGGDLEEEGGEGSTKHAASSTAGDDSEALSLSGSDSDADHSDSSGDGSRSTRRKKVSKRNDPVAFSTSISKILSTKLPTSARADPLLTRSKSTTETTAEIANEKLERKAKAKLRAEKKEIIERGRVRDVLGVESGEAAKTAEQEKRLRKIAQRGVVKLFNAVRAAQMRGEEIAREERKKRTIVGMGEREKAVNEVSKQGFLELINGKGGKKLNIEEA